MSLGALVRHIQKLQALVRHMKKLKSLVRPIQKLPEDGSFSSSHVGAGNFQTFKAKLEPDSFSSRHLRCTVLIPDMQDKLTL